MFSYSVSMAQVWRWNFVYIAGSPHIHPKSNNRSSIAIRIFRMSISKFPRSIHTPRDPSFVRYRHFCFSDSFRPPPPTDPSSSCCVSSFQLLSQFLRQLLFHELLRRYLLLPPVKYTAAEAFRYIQIQRLLTRYRNCVCDPSRPFRLAFRDCSTPLLTHFTDIIRSASVIDRGCLAAPMRRFCLRLLHLVQFLTRFTSGPATYAACHSTPADGVAMI